MSIFRSIAFILALNPLGIFLAKEWRGIVPLKSTRADVERLLGPPDEPLTFTYYLANDIVGVEYSKYGCKPAPVVAGWPTPPLEGWDVRPDTVIAIRTTLKKRIPLSSLSIDLTKFKKIRASHVPTHFYYVNRDSGFTIRTETGGVKEMVQGYIYEPSSKYDYLRCRESEFQSKP